MASIWMGDLEPYMTEGFIRQAFTSTGEVVLNIKIVSDRTQSGKPGYCFVDFADVASVERCLIKLNGTYIPGSNPRKKFKLNYSTSQKKPENLGFNFMKFGDIYEQKRALTECHLMKGLGTNPLSLSLDTSKRMTPEDQQSAAFDYAQYYQQYQNYYANAGYDPYAAAASGYADYSSPDTYAAKNNSLAFSQDVTEVPVAPVETSDYEDTTIAPDTIDTDAFNRIYMSRSEEVFDALMNCHWQPLDTVTSNIPSAI